MAAGAAEIRFFVENTQSKRREVLKRWKDLLPFKRSTQIDGIRYGFGPQRPQQVLLRFASLRWKYPIQEARSIARICHDSPLSVGDVIASKAARCKDLLPFKGSTQMASARRLKAGAGAVEASMPPSLL